MIVLITDCRNPEIADPEDAKIRSRFMNNNDEKNERKKTPDNENLFFPRKAPMTKNFPNNNKYRIVNMINITAITLANKVTPSVNDPS